MSQTSIQQEELYLQVQLLSIRWYFHWKASISATDRKSHLKRKTPRSAWVAQSMERLTSAQVMISQLMSSSPASGSVPTAQSLDPDLDSVSPSLSAPPPLVFCLSVCLSLSKITKHLKNFFNVYLFLRETERQQGRGRERGRHRIQIRLQALSCQYRAWRAAWTCEPWAWTCEPEPKLNA